MLCQVSLCGPLEVSSSSHFGCPKREPNGKHHCAPVPHRGFKSQSSIFLSEFWVQPDVMAHSWGTYIPWESTLSSKWAVERQQPQGCYGPCGSFQGKDAPFSHHTLHYTQSICTLPAPQGTVHSLAGVPGAANVASGRL